MRKLGLWLILAAAPALAGGYGYTPGTRWDVVVARHGAVPDAIRAYLPTAPGRVAAGVIISVIPRGERADAYKVTLRYRDQHGATWTRAQVLPLYDGAPHASGLYRVGDVEPLGVTVEAITYASVEER